MDLINLLWNSSSEFCTDSDVRIILRVVGIVVLAIKIAVPIILIVVGMLDMAKAITGKDDNAIKSAQQGLIKKAIAAVIVFLVITIVGLLMKIVNSDEYKPCLACINEPFGECKDAKLNPNTTGGGGSGGGGKTPSKTVIGICDASNKKINNANIEVGESMQLKTCSGESVTWSSGDASIVSVSSNGTILGESDGSTAVYATNSSGSNSIQVTVVDENGGEKPTPTPNTSTIKITNKDTTVGLGFKVTLTANKGTASVKWTSDNPEKATVEGNILDALDEGDVNICAYDKNDIKQYDCVAFHIVNKYLKITSASDVPRGQTVSFKAQVSPSGTITWSSNNSALAVDSKGNVTADGEVGECAEITASANGMTDTVSVCIDEG